MRLIYKHAGKQIQALIINLHLYLDMVMYN